MKRKRDKSRGAFLLSCIRYSPVVRETFESRKWRDPLLFISKTSLISKHFQKNPNKVKGLGIRKNASFKNKRQTFRSKVLIL